MHVDLGARLDHPSMKDKVSKEEWQTRLDLAAFYRLADHFGYAKTPANHVTARVPGEPDHFLINPGGRLFAEITASSLVKIDMEGNILSTAPTGIVNPAGYVIHSAVLMARPDINCVAHLHTVPGMAVAAQKNGFKFLCQESLRFYGRLGYHEYEGVARDLDERDRLKADLAENDVLVLQNHGSLVTGGSIGETFTRTMSWETSCQVQATAQSSGEELIVPSEAACKRTYANSRRTNRPQSDSWQAYRRIVDAYYPSYVN